MGKQKKLNPKSDLGNALIKQKNKMKLSANKYFIEHGVEPKEDN